MNRLYRHWLFPLGLQMLAFVAFALLVVDGLMANTSDPGFAKVLRNTNTANLLVWSYWWPLIVLSSVFIGRIWCVVCPIELVTSLSAKIGLKLKRPRFLQSGWVVTLFYVTILFVGVHTLAIHRVPFRMAIYLLVLAGVAILVGLLFEKNTFCASFCPVGHLLGLYARLAPFGWGVKDRQVCADCKDKSCVAKKNLYLFQGRSCGVGLVPARVDDNTECILCGQCLKSCAWNSPDGQQRSNPGWFRRPWAKDILSLRGLSLAQVGFLVVVSGFLLYEILTEWDVTKAYLLAVPEYLEASLGMTVGWRKAIVKCGSLFLVLPALLWLLPYAVYRTAGKIPLGQYLRNWTIAFIPIIAAAHACKALLKTTSRIPYWYETLSDSVGIKTAQAIIDKHLVLRPVPTWISPTLTVVTLILMVGGITLSFVVVRKLIAKSPVADRRGMSAFFLIPAVYGGLFLAMLCAWRLF